MNLKSSKCSASQRSLQFLKMNTNLVQDAPCDVIMFFAKKSTNNSASGITIKKINFSKIKNF